MKKLKKNFKKIFIILFIVLIVLIILLMFNKKAEVEVEELGSRNVQFTELSVNTENFDEVLSELPIPSINMRRKIQTFAIELIKEIHAIKDYNSQDIEKFYEENKENIEEHLYNANLEELEKLVEEISKIDSDNLQYTKSSFDLESLNIDNADKTVKLLINYNNTYDYTFIVHVDTANDSKITFELD